MCNKWNPVSTKYTNLTGEEGVQHHGQRPVGSELALKLRGRHPVDTDLQSYPKICKSSGMNIKELFPQLGDEKEMLVV